MSSTTVSYDELRALCARVMTELKTALENGGPKFIPDPVFHLHWPDHERATKIVKPGEWDAVPFSLGPFFANQEMKELFFETMREVVKATRADATVFGTDSWEGKVTAEGKKHVNTPEWEEIYNPGDGFASLIKKGWIRSEEALQVIGQTPDLVIMMKHAYRRRPISVQWLGEMRVWDFKGDDKDTDFSGRCNMFPRRPNA